MAKGGADGRNDHQIDRLAGGRIRARWRSWHVTGWRRSPKCCGGLLFVFGGQSTRERGRPARILIPANSLPSKATPSQGAPNPPLRGSLPSCRSLCGRDARAPGWGLCGRDARAPGWSLLLPPARPLADPSGAFSNPLVALRRSSWPFVDKSFYPLPVLPGPLRGPSWIALFAFL